MSCYLQSPPMTAETFEGVLEAARAGGDWAWTAIYREFAPTLLRYLRARNTTDPEDVVGDVFVRVVRKLAEFEGGMADFRAWLFAIARNRAVDEARRRRRRPETPAQREALDQVAPHGHVEAEAMGGLQIERVRSIIESLSPDQRDVLLLRILGGLKVDEVAKVVGKNPGAVKALQVRGIAAIRKQLTQRAVRL